jgi:hypothetical protein
MKKAKKIIQMTEELKQRKCELCGHYPSDILDSIDTTYTLCQNHIIYLINLCLNKEDALKLIKIHGKNAFYLHEDFYDDEGYALQPRLEEE